MQVDEFYDYVEGFIYHIFLKVNYKFDPRVDHLVHFKNDVRHNIERIKIIWNKNYKGIPNNEGAIKCRQSHYK